MQRIERIESKMKLNILLLILLVLVPFANLSAQVETDSMNDREAMFQAAKNYSYQAETRGKAIELLKELIKQDPRPEYRIELAQAQFFSGDWQSGLISIESVPESSLSSSLKLLKAQALAQNNKHTQAAALFEQLKSSPDQRSAALIGLARSAHQLGEKTKSTQAYLEFVKLGGKTTAAEYLEIGNVLISHGSTKEGLTVLKHGLEAYPKDAELAKALALNLAWQGDFVTARPLLESSAKAFPEDTKVQQALTAGYLQVGDLKALTAAGGAELGVDQLVHLYLLQAKDQEADQYLQRQLEKGTKSMSVTVALARALAELGYFYDAEQLLLAHKKYPEALRALAEQYQQAGREHEAASLRKQLGIPEKARSVKEAIPNSANSLEIAAAEFDKKNYVSARSSYDRAITEVPTTAAFIGRGQVALAEENYPAAIADAEVVLSRQARHRQALLVKARAQAYSGQYAAALETYGQLEKQSTSDPVVNYEKAQVALWSGKNAEAKELIERLKKDGNAGNIQSLEAEQALLAGQLRTARRLARASSDSAVSAQACCGLGLTAQAKSELQQINSSAVSNSFTRKLESGVDRLLDTKVQVEGSYWSEEGQDRSSDVTRWIPVKTGLEGSVADNVKLGIDAAVVRESFDSGDDLDSIRTGTALAWQINEAVAFNAAAELRSYDESSIDDGFAGSADFWYQFEAPLKAGLRYVRTLEDSNYDAIYEGIEADRVQALLNGSVNANFLWSSVMEFADYSDDNQGVSFLASARYRFYRGAVDSWLLTSAEYRDVDEATVISDAGTSSDILHPYWTPEGYTAGWVGLAVRKSLALNSYCEEERFVEAAVRGRFDSESNTGVEVQLGLNQRLSESVNLGLNGFIHRSGDWDAESALLGLNFAF